MDEAKAISPGVKLDQEIREKESQLTALKAEIKSRQRLLTQLSDSKTDPGLADKVKRLENEIFIRDRQIDALNERVISLDSKLREKGEDSSKRQSEEVIAKLQNEIATLEKFRLEADTRAQALETKLASLTTESGEEVENYRILHEGEVQEHEKTKTRLDFKDRQLSEGRADMVRLAKTIEDLTKINSDLGGKIGKLNQELEEARSAAYQSNSKAQLAEDLEKNQAALESRMKLLNEELAEAVQTAEKRTNEKEVLEKCISEQHVKVDITTRTLREVLEKLELLESRESEFKGQVQTLKTQLTDTIGALEEVKSQLRARQVQGETALSQAHEENRRLRDSLKGSEAAGKAKDRDFLRLSADLSTANARLLEREQLLSQARKALLEAQEAAKKHSSQLESDLSDRKIRIDSLRKELNSKEEALAKAQTEAALILTRHEEAKVKLQTLQETSASAELQIREWKGRYSALQRERTEAEKTLQTKETQLNHALHKVKALEEELWNRDSEGMRKDSQIVKVSQQYEETKKALSALSAKMRSAIAEKLAEANKQLEAKDTEIALLKEMLRSAQLQLKQKEGELAHSRKPVRQKEDSRVASKAVLPADRESEVISKVLKFCSDADHLLRFFAQKRRKIEVLRDSEELSPIWLQEELKLPYLPSLDQDPVLLLTDSVNQRIEFLRSALAAELESDGGLRLEASAVAEGAGESLAAQLEGYQEVTVRELLEKLRGLSVA